MGMDGLIMLNRTLLLNHTSPIRCSNPERVIKERNWLSVFTNVSVLSDKVTY